MNPVTVLAIACGLLALPFLSDGASDQDPALAGKANRYVGANVCKNCHSGAEKGAAYETWQKEPHAKAWHALSTQKAKEVAAKLKIDDPQKSAACLECHVTAYGKDPKEIKRGFKIEDGVQCESCHGPGENHYKVRFAEAEKGGAPAPIGKDEIQSGRDAATCKKCHNDKSPTYKPFCLVERMSKIEHLDPRKQRSEADLKKLRATDDPNCAVCAAKKAGEAKDAGK